MKNRLLSIVLSAAIVGGGVGAAFWIFYNNHPHELGSVTEQDLAEGYKKMGRQAVGLVDPTALKPPPRIPAHKKIRLAIGSLGQNENENTRQVADLLTAQLSGAKGLDLIERRALDKVLAEMSLTQSGLVRASDAIRVGKLLRADWFLMAGHSTVGATNALVVRIVDARTGIMRDIAVFDQTSSVTGLANELAAFVRRARENASTPKLKTFLAIGQFADVSINNRQAAFPSELRSYLTAAYRNSNILLLEREYVDALLQEVYLDLAGLTERGTNTPVQMQSAFWLVEGYFQSYESTAREVEVALRLRRVFGLRTEKTFRGQPGEPLFRQIKSAIDSTISAAGSVSTISSRVSEARAQLNAGKELHQIAVGDHDMLIPIGPGRDAVHHYNAQEPLQRKRNLEEAIRAFQTVLLLEPENSEAKYLIAVCLHDPAVGRFDEARSMLREMADSADYNVSRRALFSLGWSFSGDDDREAARWLYLAAERSKNTNDAEVATITAEQRLVDAITAEARRGISVSNELDRKALLNDVIRKIRSAESVMRHKGGEMYDDYGLRFYAAGFGTNKPAAAEDIARILPALKTNFPEIIPHLLSAAITFQLDTTNAIYQEFQSSLTQAREQPEKLLAPEWYFRNLLASTYDWAMATTNYALAQQFIEAKEESSTHLASLKLTPQDKVRLGYAYGKQENWKDALKVFEELGDVPVEMGRVGVWGQTYAPVLPGQLAGICRSKLSLAAAPLATNRFELGKPIVHLHAQASFTTEPSGIWLCIGHQLLHVTYDLQTNLAVNLPGLAFGEPTQILPEGDHVWVSTDGGGLLKYEKHTGKWNQFGEHDGLLMDEVLCMATAGGKLWLGFGRGNLGGVGFLDIGSGRLTAFTPPLTSSVIPDGTFAQFVDKEAELQPPRSPVLSIAPGPNDEILFYVNDGLRRYRVKEEIWDAPPSPGRLTALAADSEHVAVGLAYGWLSVRGRDEKQWQPLNSDVKMTGYVATATLDGSDLWVAGQGFMAVFDLKQNILRKYAYVSAHRWAFRDIQIGGGFIWAMFDGHLYRVPLRGR